MTRTWTGTGEQLLDRYTSTAQGHNWSTREEIEAAIAALEWHDMPTEGGLTLPMSTGLGIQAACEGLGLRRVEAYAIGHLPCRSDAEPGESAYCLYGIRNRFSDGAADVFIVDRGTDLIPVASDHPVTT